ncbi:MAG: hypothetical protein AB1665_05810 [Candidatus Thermoplasmatota archaeon]
MKTMTRTGRIAVCALLVSLLLAAWSVRAAPQDFERFYEDPQDAQEYPDADIRSLRSFVRGAEIIVELEVYGEINSSSGYSYWVMAGEINSTSPQFYVHFSYFEGKGYMSFTHPDSEYDFVENPQTIEGSRLSFGFPIEDAGPADRFDISASASYTSTDYMDWVYDDVNIPDVYCEPYYDFENAADLSVPGSVQGRLENGEADVYRILLSAGEGIQIDLEPARNEQSTWLTLYTSGGEYVKSSFSIDWIASLVYIPEAEGEYYIVVESFGCCCCCGEVCEDLRYTLSIRLRGLSGEGYAPAECPAYPWLPGDAWAAGGQKGILEILTSLLREANEGLGNAYPFFQPPDFRANGGVGEYLIVEYVCQEGNRYRFDYDARCYAEFEWTYRMTSTMPMSEGSSDWDETTVRITIASEGCAIIDIEYSGSVWLAYYENADGQGYFAVEQQRLLLSGEVALEMWMNDTTEWMGRGMEDYNSWSKMRISGGGGFGVNLSLSYHPGIPFLPAGDADISVDKLVNVNYSGSGWAEIPFNLTHEATYPLYFEDICNETTEYSETTDYSITCDEEVNGSFDSYFILEYNAQTNHALTTPLIVEGYLLTVLGITPRCAGTPYAPGDYEPYIEQWSSEAVYDPDSAFYTSYRLSLADLGVLALLGISRDVVTLDLDYVPKDEVERFMENPSEFLASPGHGKESNYGMAWLYLLIGCAIASILLTCAADIVSRKRALTRTPWTPPPRGASTVHPPGGARMPIREVDAAGAEIAVFRASDDRAAQGTDRAIG